MSVSIAKSILTNLAGGARFVLLVLLLTFALFYLGCSDFDLDGVDLPQTANAVGQVKRVDYEHKQITIAHDKIGTRDSLVPMVDELTMAYPVRELSMLDSLKDNDSVEFTLREDAPGEFLITELSLLKPREAQPQPRRPTR
jgi:Cu/Ag efflux protein CusF